MGILTALLTAEFLTSVDLVGSARLNVSPLVGALLVGGLIVLLFLILGFMFWSAARKNRETAARIALIQEENPYWTERGLDLAAIESLPEEQRLAAVRRAMTDLRKVDTLLSGWAAGPPAMSILDTPKSPMAEEREAVAQLIEELQTTFPDAPSGRGGAAEDRNREEG